jgi:predicted dehydrogenase
MTRRQFLKRSSAAAGGVLLLANPSAFTYAANERLDIAFIGVGGQGQSNLHNIAALGDNVVALCDVDSERASESFAKHPNARRFKDFRRLFDELGSNLDAVVVSTPDHTHAVAAAAALKLGKHLYCEKPLTRTVHEARLLRRLAAEKRLVTQLGNQGSAESGLRRGVELVWAGVFGEVREAHVWLAGGNRPLKVPSDRPPVPESLDWDLWLGPAPERPYHPSYVPGKWRDWRAFGSGIVGDFGCHTGNLMFRALKLDQLWTANTQATVITIEAQPSERDQEGYPKSSTTVVQFPSRGMMPPVKLTFYAKLTPDEALMLGHPRGAWGDLLVGSKGSLYSDCPWNTRFAMLPRGRYEDKSKLPPEILPRSKGHHREWVDACKGQGSTFSSFEIGGPLTELCQLINLASLVEGKLEYDTTSGRILNSALGQELLSRPYRESWNL